MAGQRSSSGITVGQLVTLTVGFLVASVVIFIFGFWVGRDLAEQRLARYDRVIRMPIASPAPVATEVLAAGASPGRMPGTTPTAPAVRVKAVPTAPPVRIVRPAGTATRRRPRPTAPTAPLSSRPTRTSARAVDGEWTVQAGATTDPVEAVVLARRLRAKGYEADTTQGPIGGVTWYRVRVGRFRDRAGAKGVEERLRTEEGLEAAYVTPR